MKSDKIYKELLGVLKKHDCSPKDAATVVLYLFAQICESSGVDTVVALRGSANDLEKDKMRKN